MPGLRPSKNDVNANKADRKARAGVSSQKGVADDSVSENVDLSGGKQRMQAKIREQAKQSEFNLG